MTNKKKPKNENVDRKVDRLVLKFMADKYGARIDGHIAEGGARPLPNPEDLPDPTCEHIAELGRWLVHEGSLGPKQMAWNAVIGYASMILRIAWAEVDEKTFNTYSSEQDPTARISQEIYREKRYWAGDPVIEELKGDPEAIKEWLKKVGMWRNWI